MVIRVGIIRQPYYVLRGMTLIDGLMQACVLSRPLIAGAISSEMLLTQGALN